MQSDGTSKISLISLIPAIEKSYTKSERFTDQLLKKGAISLISFIYSQYTLLTAYEVLKHV